MSCSVDQLELKMGDTWEQPFVIKDEDGIARNLTGLKVRGRLYSNEAGVRTTRATFDSDNAGEVDIVAASGEVTFNLSSTASAALSGVGAANVRWYFSFELYDDSVSPEWVQTQASLNVIVVPNEP